MSNKSWSNSAFEVLKETSRTFYIPISRLPNGPLQQAVASAYLCLRAIDEIEDHKSLKAERKAQLLLEISDKMQQMESKQILSECQIDFGEEQQILPEVTLRIFEWLFLCPEQFRPRIADTTATMSERMSRWVTKNFKILTKNDLDQYTFAVAGTVGLLLSEIWEWAEGIVTERRFAVGFGRGLQAVNILRNHEEDLQRGIQFYPESQNCKINYFILDWKDAELIAYAKQNLKLAFQYIKALPQTSGAYKFSIIPYSLAKATVEVILLGKEKLTREEVNRICLEEAYQQLDKKQTEIQNKSY